MKTAVRLIAALLLAPLAAAEPHDVFGTFVTEEGDSHIEITDCGDGTPCGRIVWVDPATLENGQTPESLRVQATGEPVLGLLMLQDFERAGKDWREGTIYSPKADKRYSSRLKRRQDQTLEVKGCIGFICQTQVWTPAAP